MSSNEWYTPPIIIDAVRRIWPTIDLDPASCEEANRIVGATKFLTKADNGLSKPWRGRVFVNPPYSSKEDPIAAWVAKAEMSLLAPFDTEIIMVLNASTSASWFKSLWSHTICFAHDRVKFLLEGGKGKSKPMHGSAIVYMGDRPEIFARAFEGIGAVYRTRK